MQIKRLCVRKLLLLTTNENKLIIIKRCNYKSLICANLKEKSLLFLKNVLKIASFFILTYQLLSFFKFKFYLILKYSFLVFYLKMIFFAFNPVSENTCITGVLPEKILSLKKNALNTLYVKFNRLIQLSKKRQKYCQNFYCDKHNFELFSR